MKVHGLVKLRSPNGPTNAMVPDYSSSGYSSRDQSSHSFQKGTFSYWYRSISRIYNNVELYSKWKTIFWVNLSYKDVGCVAWGPASRPDLQMWGSLQLGTLGLIYSSMGILRNSIVVDDTGREIASVVLDRSTSADKVLYSWLELTKGFVCCFYPGVYT